MLNYPFYAALTMPTRPVHLVDELMRRGFQLKVPFLRERNGCKVENNTSSLPYVACRWQRANDHRYDRATRLSPARDAI